MSPQDELHAPGPCSLCGKDPATGYASEWSAATGERWYCHGDDDQAPTCYERRGWPVGTTTHENVDELFEYLESLVEPVPEPVKLVCVCVSSAWPPAECPVHDILRHDTAVHLAAGGFGITAAGCPRCDQQGGYVRLRPTGDEDC